MSEPEREGNFISFQFGVSLSWLCLEKKFQAEIPAETDFPLHLERPHFRDQPGQISGVRRELRGV